MKERDHFKTVAVINYLVKKLNEKGVRQAGKTKIQKLMFCLDCSGLDDYGYSLYHYGPYSPYVESELNYAKYLGGVDVRWETDKGYFITPAASVGAFEDLLKVEEKGKIDKVVDALGSFSAEDLSLFTTIIYLIVKKSCRDPNDLFVRTKALKPQYPDEQIRKYIEIALKISSD